MAFEVFSICSLPWTLSCSSPGASVGVRAILARFVVVVQVREAAPTRPQTVPGSRGVKVCEARGEQAYWHTHACIVLS
jgi:hypothetical protein